MSIHDNIIRGFSSKASPLVASLHAADSRELPFGLKSASDYVPPIKPIPLDRYYSPEFAKLEKEKLWKKTWQFACREEDIPNVGDRYRYDVGTLSWIVVRSAPDRIQAFNNTCLHRGTQLCTGHGTGESIRCPFHAWEWTLEGKLKHIPSRWDFKHVHNEAFRLPEAQVSLWGGYVFINPDPSAPPLEQFLGPLPQFFEGAEPADRFTVFHLSKKVRANWKVVMEAFLEAYHVIETHTDSMPFTGDASTQYDIWEDGNVHLSRLITPLATPSPHLGDEASVADAANATFQAFAMAMPGVPVPTYDPTSPLSPRAQVAEWRRQIMGGALGRDLSSWSDAALVDTIQYLMFPNFCPWFGEGLPLVYQFLPYGDNPDESVMNVRLTSPLPGGGVKPPPAPLLNLDFDEMFSSQPAIGLLSHIFDQDMSNLPIVQIGLKAAADDRAVATLGRYQEQRIRHFHDVLEKVLGL